MLYAEAANTGVLSFQSGTYTTDTLLTFVLGLGIVFVGLVSLVAIVKCMGWIMGKTQRKSAALEPPHVPAMPQQHAAAPEPNHGELIAAVSAALATVMGKQVNGIRILSMKKVDD